jgi:hypothetical protein
MPQGYYTIEQWKKSKNGQTKWVAVLHLPFGQSLTAAEHALEGLRKPGFYRLVQTQRVIWVEMTEGKPRLRKSHAGSPESLDDMARIFERTGGKFPAEEVRAARRRIKAAQSR